MFFTLWTEAPQAGGISKGWTRGNLTRIKCSNSPKIKVTNLKTITVRIKCSNSTVIKITNLKGLAEENYNWTDQIARLSFDPYDNWSTLEERCHTLLYRVIFF